MNTRKWIMWGIVLLMVVATSISAPIPGSAQGSIPQPTTTAINGGQGPALTPSATAINGGPGPSLTETATPTATLIPTAAATATATPTLIPTTAPPTGGRLYLPMVAR